MPLLTINLPMTESATLTYPLLKVVRPGRLILANYTQTAAAAATSMTVQLKNDTRTQLAMSAALTVTTIAALGGANFVLNTDGSADLRIGDVITAVRTINTQTVAPGNTTIVLDVLYGPADDRGVGS